jgi:hypothetical protein
VDKVNLHALSKAIESRDGATLAGFYADDVLLRIIDKMNPPHQPKEIRGHDAVSEYFSDICGRAMTHKVQNGVESDNRLAFTQTCRYPDGKGVFCATTIELDHGKIARQIVVQAWDE